MKRLLDPRVWLGLAITAVALWLSFRDVDFSELGRELARANWWLLIGGSLPAYLWSVQLRAQRWRVLARGVADVPTPAAFRATAVGFAVNNVLPLRLGELVRVWWLAREIRAPAAALFGTYLLERVIDVVVVLGFAAFVLAGWWRALLLLAAAGVLAVTLALRRWPGPALRVVHRAARAVLSPALADRVTGLAGAVAQGLAGLRGRRDFAHTALLTLLIWGVAAVIPFWAAIAALGTDLGGPLGELHGALRVLVAVAAAIAIPTAPGFFGVYHGACRAALTPLGVPKELALAIGTAAHAVFWMGITALGLLVALRGGPQRLREAVREAERTPS